MADIMEYLASLKKEDLDELYDDPWACQAVLRSLPPLSKHFVMKMLFTPQLPLETISGWTQSGLKKPALAHLSKLRVLLKSTTPPNPGDNRVYLHMNEKFKSQIINSMCSNSQSAFAADKRPASAHEHVPDATTLDEFARQRWDEVLHFLVGSASRPPSSFIIDLLVAADLMQWETDDRLRISNSGFKFLLRDINTQIWALLLKYIDRSDTIKVEEGNAYVVKRELISFLLRLSFLSFGQGYPVKELTPTQRSVMHHLREFGLIYLRKDTSHRFYPTRIAISLFSGKSVAAPVGHETSKAEQDGFIVLESNYRLYAYTSSSLKIALLSLFVKMQYRLPSFAMGVITRESIRTALLNGISSEQIISFIQQNVHDQAKKRGTPVPETVIDQIRLWEAERNRVSYQKGFLYDSFSSEEMYREVVKYSKDISVFLWSNDEKKFLMAAESGHENIKSFIKKRWG